MTADRIATDGVLYTGVQQATRGLLFLQIKTTPIQHTLTYRIRYTPTTIQASLRYIVPHAYGVQKQLQYIILKSTSATSTLLYRVQFTPAAIQKSLMYAIPGTSQIDVQRGLQYCIQHGVVPVTSQLQYCVNRVATTTKSLQYSVSLGGLFQKSLNYSVLQTPSAKTSTLGYDILRSTITPVALQYNITAISQTDVQHSLQYRIEKGVTVTKGLTYYMAGMLPLTRSDQTYRVEYNYVRIVR